MATTTYEFKLFCGRILSPTVVLTSPILILSYMLHTKTVEGYRMVRHFSIVLIGMRFPPFISPRTKLAELALDIIGSSLLLHLQSVVVRMAL